MQEKQIFPYNLSTTESRKYGENGIIVATEERPEQIRENVLKFGWDLQALEDENKLVIIDACSTKIGIPSQEKIC